MSEAKIDPGTKVTIGVDATADGLQYIKEGKLDKTMPPQKVILIRPRLVTKASLPSG
jgi:hypothetical protein